MSAALLQDVIVALTALAAAWVVARRVIGFATRARGPGAAARHSPSPRPTTFRVSERLQLTASVSSSIHAQCPGPSQSA